MKLSRVVIFLSAVLILTGFLIFRKDSKNKNLQGDIASTKVQEIQMMPIDQKEVEKPLLEPAKESVQPLSSTAKSEPLPDADRIEELFAIGSKLPIVETINYTSRVPWLKGRPAWIADYASHYSTSRHFIARSLNRKKDYFTQSPSPGDKFNVFKSDKNFSFYLLLDLSRSRLWFYFIDNDTHEKTLLKTYNVGVGRQDTSRKSGYLTPSGKFNLGNKVAIYRPKVLGYFQDKKIEMIKIFGTRWIPFENEELKAENLKGLGLHGTPWIEGPNGELVEDLDKIGKYDSDGCVRLAASDIEEIFAIVISRPTCIEIVKNFYDAELLGKEKQINN